VPGTAKTWVSEHLAAAISGDSTLLVQGTAGTAEEALRYGWNYARLLADGPSHAALVPSPVMVAMRRGAIVRVEELTRLPADVQDALVTVLSEKTLPIPELADEVQAVHGFNLIATADDRDRGVNELSAALRRRFNTVILPLPASAEEEVGIVVRRVAELGQALGLPAAGAHDEIARVVTVLRELRAGATADGRVSLKVPTGTLSTAGRSRSSWAASRSPPTSVTACSGPPRSPVGSSAPSSTTPCTTPSRGGSTWRPWCATVRGGRRSTRRAWR
jgi:MoxR-like ATPase